MAEKAAARDKVNYDLKAKNSVLSLGDLVLVKNVGLRGKHKIADMWEGTQTMVVVSQPNPDVPVYEVKDTNTGARTTRLLHRILLLPFMGLPRVEQSEEIENVPSSTEQVGTSPNNSPASIPDNYSSSESSCGLSSGRSYSSDDESSTSETGMTEQIVGKYVPPRHRKPGQSGLLPRTKCLPMATETGSSSEDAISQRPGRTRKPPPWMRTGDWVVGQQKDCLIGSGMVPSRSNLIKQGEIVTGRPCGSVAQWSECSNGVREGLGSSPGRAMCFFLRRGEASAGLSFEPVRHL